MIVTNKNFFPEEIKRKLNSSPACYHSVQSLQSSQPLSKNVTIRIYKIIILPVVLCGWEIWSLTFTEEYGMRVSENRVLRRIFGPKSDKVIGGWRKLHEVSRDLYSSPSILKMTKSKRIRYAGHVA
jgi:hypothetical protein